jgi:hypothetical protein
MMIAKIRYVKICVAVLAWMGVLLAATYRSFRKLPRQGDTSKGELLAVDVGPIPRQLLTRTDDFFGDLFSLTLCDKLIRGQVPE